MHLGFVNEADSAYSTSWKPLMVALITALFPVKGEGFSVTVLEDGDAALCKVLGF